MPHEFLEDVATADIAFRAWAPSREALFADAAEATMNVMVGDLATIEGKLERTLTADAESPDLLLVNFLQEFIYYKDAQRLLLRPVSVRISEEPGRLAVEARCAGEELDMTKHELKVDVKAVTYHRLNVEQTSRGWEAFVILDI